MVSDRVLQILGAGGLVLVEIIQVLQKHVRTLLQVVIRLDVPLIWVFPPNFT